MISKQDFIAWRDSDITKQLLHDIAETANDAAVELLTRKETNQDRDMFLKGFVDGIKSVTEWKLEVLQDED